MRVLITGGANGQLRHELLQSRPHDCTLVGCLADEPRLDVTNAEAVTRVIADHAPDVILNAAAYTAVDKAESEPERAYAVNAAGVSNLADAALACDAHLVHVSTDFVFGGGDNPNGKPFATSSATAPLGVYGESKLAGESLLAMRLPGQGCTIRTSWLYSSHGANFVKTMLRLMNERDEIGVVADQIGSPTWARSLARAVWRAAERRLEGVLHWSDAGVASWYDLAVATLEEGRAAGLVTGNPRIRPIATADYPTPAARPTYSVLDTAGSRERFGLDAEHWRGGLRDMLGELA